MSIQFSDTANYKGLVQFYEKEIGANVGDVSGNTTKLKQFTAEANLALDDFLSIVLPISGTAQFDDSGHTDYPIIYFNLVSGQRDYPFTSDETGNLILDIYKVLILPSATSSIYQEINPIDQQSSPNVSGFIDGQNLTGIPTRYDKTANAFFLDPIPSYSVSQGLKVFINREALYFSSTDTTKKPGVPGILHQFFFLVPAMNYARRNNLSNLPRLELSVEKEKIKIKDYFAGRQKDIRPILRGREIDYQ